MWGTVSLVLLVAYLPGVALYRLPVGQPQVRASLPVEERVYWYVILSLALTSVVGLGLAAAGWYRFDRLLWVNGAVISLVIVAGGLRGWLRLNPTTWRPSWSALIPAAILVVSGFASLGARPAEYIIGGKDPGTYMNAGIQIAQGGALRIADELIAAVPEDSLDLYTQEVGAETYHSSRFMGFYLVNPQTGTVMGQFPHLYPVWIAVAYGVNGLTGARYVVTLLALVGVLSVYFFGAWLVGRPAAAAGALLLAINVAQVWYSRYPNAEILQQALTFGGLLAYSRATIDGDRMFAAVAGVLVTLAAFTHLTGVFSVAILLVAACLSVYDGRRPSFVFLAVAIAGGALGALYYSTLLAPYIEQYLAVIRRFSLAPAGLAVALGFGSLLFLSRTRVAPYVQRWLPWGVVAIIWALSAYAYFFRVPEFRLAPHDAASLRTFAAFYVSPLGLLMALGGLALVARRRFWPGLAFVLLFLGFSVLFFYKIRIIPEHFWAVRRFVAVTLPGVCLLIGAAAFPFGSVEIPRLLNRRWSRLAIAAVGGLVVIAVGTTYLDASTAIMHHIEYEDVVPRIEAINERIADTDLVLVESRQASDLHTLALPLAYIYARPVLVLQSAHPSPTKLQEFLVWARGRYERILFVGGGGTLLLSNSIDAVRISSERFSVPEYESAWDAYPQEVRLKRYDVAVYELVPRVAGLDAVDVDVGFEDELLLRRFHDQEVLGGTQTTFRWSGDRSFVSLLGFSSHHRAVTLWLNDGGRPDSAGPATVEIALNNRVLGTVTATDLFEAHRVEVPPDLAAQVAASGTPGLLQLLSSTWNPGDELGVDDPRELGVMVDRVTVE